LEPVSATRAGKPAWIDRPAVLLANARSGIALLVDRLNPKQVWMPSYLCDSMVAGVDQSKTTLRHYEVTDRLALGATDFLEHVGAGDLVFFIAYFGFPQDAAAAASARARGAWVVKDACQAMLSDDREGEYDFVLFSPRKFVGVPDGGILAFRPGLDLGEVALSPPPAEWWLDSFRACTLRGEYDRHGGDRGWFELFRRCEAESPIGAYAMSELTRLILSHGVDAARISERRRRNYERLTGRLASVALFPRLPAGVVPLGFPISVDGRDLLRNRLFEHEIFPAVHWPLPDSVPPAFAATHRLAERILTLPCDQRYGEEEMDRMAAIVAAVVET